MQPSAAWQHPAPHAHRQRQNIAPRPGLGEEQCAQIRPQRGDQAMSGSTT